MSDPLVVIDSSVDVTVIPTTNESMEETVRRQAKEQGRQSAAAWLNDEFVRIRADRMDRLIDLLNHLHEQCIIRIKTSILTGYAEGSNLLSRVRVPMSNNLGVIVDELADQRSEKVAHDGIATAFAMFDDTRRQAVTAFSRTLREQQQRARAHAAVVESDITADTINEFRRAATVDTEF